MSATFINLVSSVPKDCFIVGLFSGFIIGLLVGVCIIILSS